MTKEYFKKSSPEIIRIQNNLAEMLLQKQSDLGPHCFTFWLVTSVRNFRTFFVYFSGDFDLSCHVY